MSPVYLYQCMDEHTHTRLESMGEGPQTVECPRCDRPAKKVMAPPARPVVKGGTPTFHGRDERE